MTRKEIQEIVEKLSRNKTPHMLLVRSRGGIALSSYATGDDIYEYMQALVDTNPVMLDIMQSVIDSRKKKPKREKVYLN